MNDDLEIERILRVDHAGEKGAINIYTAQIAISKVLWPQIVSQLENMLSHEQKHFKIFDSELKRRGARSCYALYLWAVGGRFLGLLTGLLGPKSIFACTAAVEDTVYRHVQEQIEFLRNRDKFAFEAVLAISEDEINHLDHALKNGGIREGFNRFIWYVVSLSTGVAIWLSKRL